MSEIDCIFIVPSDQPRIVELAEKYLGGNYFKDEYFEEENRLFIIAVTHDYWTTTGKEQQASIVGYVHYTIDLDEATDNNKGYISDIVVDEEYQRQGIATSLVKVAMEHLQMVGVNEVTSHAWEYPDKKVQVRKALELNGFVEVQYLPEHYHHPESDYICPICGCPCHCSAFLMRATL